ncbi:hypothetical protein [Streptomyces sp. MMS24-I29]|uniref:hypothetical protein n=1 Tax=Streptomyces sp. MMS24-I29 TaxID=3351480 RepID=UPI003C7C6CB4
MRDVIAFYESYLDFEHSGAVAILEESDERLSGLRGEILDTFWYKFNGVPLSPSFGRPKGMTPDQLVQLAEQMKPKRRSLFLVTEHKAPKELPGQSLYAAYASGDREQTARSYTDLLYAVAIDDGLKIVALYREDVMKGSPPVCWRHSQGLRIPRVGLPVAVRALREPTGRAAHQQHWQTLASRI